MRRKPDADDPRIGAPSPADAPTTPRAPAVRRRATYPSDPSDTSRRSTSDRRDRGSGPAVGGSTAGGPGGADAPGGGADAPEGGTDPASERITPGHTRVGGTWVAFILGAVVLIFLLVFVVQNLVPVEVTFLGLRGTLPLGVWLLFAAVAGVLLLAIPGLARLLQWRRATGAAGGRPRR